MCVGALGAAAVLVILLHVVSGVPTVKTLAGYGNIHYRDGVGTEAAFQNPYGVAIISDGRIVVADTYNHCIRLVTAQGAVTTLAGTDTSGYADGAGAAARFHHPFGVAVLPNGNIAVTDYNNNRIRIVTLDGVVNTLAGDGGSCGFADGTGISAKFCYPYGVAVLPNNDIVVTDIGGNRIRKVTPGGVVSTLAGSGSIGFADGTTTNAIFRYPSGIAVLSNGDVVVADSGNHCIRLVSNGFVSTLAGSCGSSGYVDGAVQTARFNNPYGVAVLPNGDVAVADFLNNRIRIVAHNGTVTTLAGSSDFYASPFADGTSETAKFNGPHGVAILANGSIVVADRENHRIRLVAPSGAVTTLAGCESIEYADGVGIAARFRNSTGVAAFTNGNIIAADSLNHRIRLVMPTGAVSTLAGSGTYGWADGPLTTAQFKQPQGLSVFPDGRIVVADTGNNRIRVVTPDGIVTTLAGSNMGFADGAGASASFHAPRGVAILLNGSIVVADTDNNRIRIVTLDGNVTTLAGGDSSGFADGATTSARFNYPSGVAILPNGNIVVADTYNSRIRLVTPDGVVTTLAGGSNYGFADGIGTSARFNYPGGVAVLPNGNMIVADTDNNRIRIVTLDGVVTTLAGGGGSGFADGLTTNAMFNSPMGITILPNGNIVVADTSNGRLRVIEFPCSTAETTTTQPSNTSATTPPSTTATTTQPSNTSATTPPSTTATTTQPSNTTATATPSSTATTAQPSNTTATATPSSTATTTQPSNTTATAPPSPTATTTQPSNTTATATPSSTATTTQPSNTTATATPSPTVVTTQPPACAESSTSFYNEARFLDCSAAVSCIVEMCTCLGVRSHVASCLSHSTATCSQRTRCIGKSVRCLNGNAVRFLSLENCSSWATPIHLDARRMLETSQYLSSAMSTQCENAMCRYGDPSYNPRQCNTSAAQICAWGAMNSFNTELVIEGPFRGTFDTDAMQEALEKDLASRFGAPVAVEVAYQSGIVVASLSIPPGYDDSQLRLMSNSSAWLRYFKALMGENVTSVRITNLPAAPPPRPVDPLVVIAVALAAVLVAGAIVFGVWWVTRKRQAYIDRVVARVALPRDLQPPKKINKNPSRCAAYAPSPQETSHPCVPTIS